MAERAVDAAVAANGPIDVLVNNAGLARGTEQIAEGTGEAWREMIETNVLGLLDTPSDGGVYLDNTTVSRLTDRQLAECRNREIGFIFQSFHLVADLNALDNVQIPLLYRDLSNKERREMAEQALERVGLKARMHHFPTQLSGGQQQRVAIARAIVGSPRLLLADEPTGNLDSVMGEEVMGILQDYNKDAGVTVVMVTHDQQLAERTERIVRLFDGRQVH